MAEEERMHFLIRRSKTLCGTTNRTRESFSLCFYDRDNSVSFEELNFSRILSSAIQTTKMYHEPWGSEEVSIKKEIIGLGIRDYRKKSPVGMFHHVLLHSEFTSF